MIENDWIRFNPDHWGYDFTCVDCGAGGTTEGEAPVSAMDAMKESGWDFRTEKERFLPVCPACAGP